MNRRRNKPVSCRSHRAKIGRKPINVLRRMRAIGYGALVGNAFLNFFGGPIAAAVGAALGPISKEILGAGGGLVGALVAQKLFLKRR